MPVPTLLLSGTCGSGKSLIALEVHDLLSEAGVGNAMIDLDALTQHWPAREPFNGDLKLQNLRALWPNHREHGATHLVLAGVLQERAELDGYHAAIPDAEIVVCRLLAPEALRRERLRRRMPAGPGRDWHLRRTVELERILDVGGAEDVTVLNDERAPREVAREVLARVGWM